MQDSSRKRIVSQINNAFQTGNLQEFLEVVTDDIYWEVVGQKDTFSGKAAVSTIWQKYNALHELPKISEERMIEGPDNIVCEGKVTMQGEDKPFDMHYADVYTFEGDKVRTMKSYCIMLNGDKPKA